MLPGGYRQLRFGFSLGGSGGVCEMCAKCVNFLRTLLPPFCYLLADTERDTISGTFTGGRHERDSVHTIPLSGAPCVCRTSGSAGPRGRERPAGPCRTSGVWPDYTLCQLARVSGVH